MANMLQTPTYTFPERGSHKLTEDQWLAMKALGTGYERIAFHDGICLTFLGLADGTEPGRFKLTEDGQKFLTENS